MKNIDAFELTANLIKCPSVTPDEGGAITLLDELLSQNGFECTRIERGGVSNLFARWGGGNNGRTFGFNGHTDVVPVGDIATWSVDPFGAEVKDGFLYGRGATDMKSGVAAFVAAAIDFTSNTPPDGSVVITITGDEEGDAIDGTTAILDWMNENGQSMDHCLVGEPTSPNHMGEMVKIGRRGSLTAFITVQGVQGHAAYPFRANNPVSAMVQLMTALEETALDDGTEHFDQSTLAITTIDVGNTATNVIPETCRATVNIRFNDAHSGKSLTDWLQNHLDAVSEKTKTRIQMNVKISGESFITPPGELSNLISQVVQEELGVTPELSTTGGTSDARFVKNLCPVTEFGLVGKTMHAVDERVEIAQIHQLKSIYGRILTNYFA